VTACIAPTEIVTDWHTVELNTLPPEDVLHYMTADPVTVAADTPIRALAREMIDAMVHRVIVVDKQFHPVGIVSSMDLVAALARSPVTP
jgi:CBS domain-containing protein